MSKNPLRNDPCHCGSGRKYKRCHLKVDTTETQIAPLTREVVNSDGVLTGRPFIDTVHQGFRFRAVGGRMYYGPVDESFHEFVLKLLREHLTHEWIREELARPSDEQHLLIRWFLEMDQLLATRADDHGRGVKSVEMTGGVKTLLALGYDVYSLRHAATILPKMIKRLKNKAQFQGALYEMAVAAIVSRCGLKLQWLNADEKHCEFIAREQRSSLEVGFEAKSHHRPGVLHQGGEPQTLDEMKLKLGDHVRRALEQAPDDKPFVIFNDMNLPTGLPEDVWRAKVEESLAKGGGLENAQAASVVIATNFAWHFSTEGPAADGLVTILEVPQPKYPLPKALLDRIAIACSQYGYVPPKLDELGLSFDDLREPDR